MRRQRRKWSAACAVAYLPLSFCIDASFNQARRGLSPWRPFHGRPRQSGSTLSRESPCRRRLHEHIGARRALCLGYSANGLRISVLSLCSRSLFFCPAQVNLPAHCVILQDTVQYTGFGLEPLPEGQVLQMIGRAGRPGFDTQAVALILTTTALEDRYRNLLSGSVPLESR